MTFEDNLKRMMTAAGYLADAGLHVVDEFSPAILFALADGDKETAGVIAHEAFEQMRVIASQVRWIDGGAREVFGV